VFKCDGWNAIAQRKMKGNTDILNRKYNINNDNAPGSRNINKYHQDLNHCISTFSSASRKLGTG